MSVKLAAYARVSTKSDDQDHSYLSQKHYFETEVLNLPKYSNCEMFNIYTDKDTATRFKRKGFLQMLHDAGIDIINVKTKLTFIASDRKPLFNRILVTNLSRFARDTAIIDPIRELSKKGVFIDFLSDNKSTENESDMMYIELMFTFAANESRDKSIKVRDGLKRSAERGDLFINQLYGYDYIQGEKKLNIIEKEAEIVNLIFDLYNNGYGFRRILNHLEENKINTRKGNPFSLTALKNILSNEKYAGILIRNKWSSGVVFNKHSPKKIKSQYKFEDVIPAVISEEKFNKAKNIREGKLSHQTQKGIYKGISKYANLLVCSKCNANYVRNTEYKKNTREVAYHFYNCSNKKKHGSKVCNAKNIKEEWIDWAFEHFANDGIFKTLENFKEDYIIEINLFRDKLLSRIDKTQEKEASKLKDELLKLDEQKKRLAKLYTMGQFNDEELLELGENISKEYDKVKKKLYEASMSNEEILKAVSEVEATIKEIENFELSDDDNCFNLINKVYIEESDSEYDIKSDKYIDQKAILFLFEFKMFGELYKIAEKYVDDKVKETFSKIMVIMEL